MHLINIPSISSLNSFICLWTCLTVDGEVFKIGNTLDKPSEKQVDASLENVPGFDGVEVVQIAAGAEHSAAVTGKKRGGGNSVMSYIS